MHTPPSRTHPVMIVAMSMGNVVQADVASERSGRDEGGSSRPHKRTKDKDRERERERSKDSKRRARYSAALSLHCLTTVLR